MKFLLEKWKAAYDAGRGRPSDSRAVVPYSNSTEFPKNRLPSGGRPVAVFDSISNDPGSSK